MIGTAMLVMYLMSVGRYSWAQITRIMRVRHIHPLVYCRPGGTWDCFGVLRHLIAAMILSRLVSR